MSAADIERIRAAQEVRRTRPRTVSLEAWNAATNEQRKRIIARWSDEGRMRR